MLYLTRQVTLILVAGRKARTIHPARSPRLAIFRSLAYGHNADRARTTGVPQCVLQL